MGVHSGKFGFVNGMSAIRTWQVNDVSAPKKYVHSGTLGGPGRKRGIRDFTGSFGAYGGLPAVMPGAAFTFAGYTAPTNDTEGGTGDVYSGSAIVDQVAVTWNYETGDIIAHTVNFSGNGELARSTAVYTDETTPAIEVPIDLSITADGEDVCNVTTVTLTITAENKSYVNSCTDGWTKRKPGPIDATLAIAVQDTNPDEFVASIGDSILFNLFVNDTDFWLLKWMHYKDNSGLTVNRETGDIIGFTANFEFDGFAEGIATPGEITEPGEVTAWWPAS